MFKQKDKIILQSSFWKDNIYTKDIMREKISMIISKYLKHLLLSTMLYNKILFRELNLRIMVICNHSCVINMTLVLVKRKTIRVIPRFIRENE